MWSQPTASWPMRAGAAIGTTRLISPGRSRATSSATMPPSDPPIDRASLPIPSAPRKGPAVRLAGDRVPRRRTAGAVAAAKQVHADDAELLCVEDLAGPDPGRPPVAGGVG